MQKIGTYLNVLVPNCTWTNKGSDYTTYGSPMPMRRNLVQCSVVSDTNINLVYSLNDTFNGSGNLGSFTGAIGTTVANPSTTELEASSNTGYPVISAVISTVPGKEYTVSTDYNNATFVGGYTESVFCEVIEGGITVASQSMTMTGSTYSLNYTAGAGSASVRYTYVLTPNPGPPPPPALPPFLFVIDNVKAYYLDTSIVNDTVCESKSGYRYGFNGMEKVDEISGEGNGYDFGARMYDGRLGRWFSVDPLMKHYPAFSCYSYAGNSTIVVIDKAGRKLWDPILNVEIKVTYVNGNPIFKTINGDEPSEKFKTDAIPLLTTLSKSATGRILIDLYMSISTLVVFDLNDKVNNKDKNANSVWRPICNDKNEPIKNPDGYYNKVIITPFLLKIEKSALENKIEYEEKLIQVLTVEYGHFSSLENIKIYDNIEEKTKIYYDPLTFAKVYNKLINEAIRNTLNFRNERKMKIDVSAFLPYSNLKKTDVGSELQLESDINKIYEDSKPILIFDPDDVNRKNKFDNGGDESKVYTA